MPRCVLRFDLASIIDVREKAELVKRSNLSGAVILTANWISIFLIYFLVTIFPNVLTIAVAFILLPGRQLGLSVLMHECAHKTLFKSDWCNNFFGHWFCALPVFNDLHKYRDEHMIHHRGVGTSEDPDLGNYESYPIEFASFRRKVLRDLTGRTGMRSLGAILFFTKEKELETSSSKRTYRPLLRIIVSQFSLLLIFANLGAGWFYLIWVAVFMTTFMLVIRVRQVAEHGGVPDLYDPNPLKNTRTVDAPWWQRFLLAPNWVNFHMVHHLMPGVPCYRLRSFRQKLKKSGVLNEVPNFLGYGQLIEHVVVT